MSKKLLKDNTTDICTDLECAEKAAAKNTLMQWIKDQNQEKQKITLSVYNKITDNLPSTQKERTFGDIQAELEMKALSAKNTVDAINIPKGKEALATQLIADALSKSWDEKLKSGQPITFTDGMIADPAMVLSVQMALDSGSKPALKANSPSRSLELNF